MLVVDKPLGWTSTDVVRKVKFMLRHNGLRNLKVGHAGTLDPLATGVLVVCLGKATKSVEALQAEEKEYVAEMKLGATTPSFDMEHPEDAAYPWEHITREEVEQALAALTGERLQMPPLYSAKKIDGQRAYEYAREGEEVKLRAAPINIYAMEPARIRPAPHQDTGGVQQGYLHPFARPRNRRSARQRGLPHLAPPDTQRPVHCRGGILHGRNNKHPEITVIESEASETAGDARPAMYGTGCSGNRRSLSGREARVLTEKTARVKQTRFFFFV